MIKKLLVFLLTIVMCVVSAFSELNLAIVFAQSISLESNVSLNDVFVAENADEKLGEILVSQNSPNYKDSDFSENETGLIDYGEGNNFIDDGKHASEDKENSLVGNSGDTSYENTEYQPDSKHLLEEKNIDSNNYRVFYNKNEPTDAEYISKVIADQNMYTYGSHVLISDNIPVLQDYIFKGWNTERNGFGTQYSQGESLIIIEDIILYAQWEPIKYTIHYMGYPDSDFEIYKGKRYGTLMNPTDPEQDFIGWYSGPDGDAIQITSETVADDNSPKNLYSHWGLNRSGDINMSHEQTIHFSDFTISEGAIEVTDHNSLVNAINSGSNVNILLMNDFALGSVIPVNGTKVVNIYANPGTTHTIFSSTTERHFITVIS